jgi:hypothetical protein
MPSLPDFAHARQALGIVSHVALTPEKKVPYYVRSNILLSNHARAMKAGYNTKNMPSAKGRIGPPAEIIGLRAL